MQLLCNFLLLVTTKGLIDSDEICETAGIPSQKERHIPNDSRITNLSW